MTSLKGNLNSVDLANIFQMLSMNQREGTLYIFDGSSRKAIYFGHDGVSMLTRGKHKPDALGRILIRHDKLTADQLAEALRLQSDTAGRLLGQVLVEHNLASRADVEDALKTQIEEEVYSLFIWKDAQFEFVEGEPDDEFRSHDGVTKLTFNVNSLIMEAAKRVDEWEWIQKVLPTSDEILKYTGRNVSLDDEIFTQAYAGKVLATIDGKRNVDEIVDASYAGRFEVTKILALLLEGGAIETVPVGELKREAQDAVSAGDTSSAVKFLSRLVALKADTPEMHKQLAEAFEARKELERAAFHYKVYGEVLANNGDRKGAYDVYRRLVDCLPTDLAAADRLVEIFASNTEGLEEQAGWIINLGKTTAEAYVELRRQNRAIQILHRVVSLGPEDIDLRNRLIQVYLQSGMTSDAIAEYDAIAETALAVRDYEQAEKIFRKILTIDRNREDAQAKLNQLLSRKKLRQRGIRIAIVGGILLAGGLYGGIEGWNWYRRERAAATEKETSFRSEFARLRADHVDLHQRIGEALKKLTVALGDVDQVAKVLVEQAPQRADLAREADLAAQLYFQLSSQYAGVPDAEDASAAGIALQGKIRDLSAYETQLRTQLQEKIDSLWEEVDLKWMELDTEVLHQQLEKILELSKASSTWITGPKGTRAKDLYGNVGNILDGYHKMTKDMEEARARQDVAAAQEAAISFLEEYLRPKGLFEKVTIPRRVESSPPGARVIVDDGPDDGRYVTPCVVDLPVHKQSKLRLAADGFQPFDIDVYALRTVDKQKLRSEIQLAFSPVLRKDVVLQTGGSPDKISAAGVIVGDKLIVPTRGKSMDVFEAVRGTRRPGIPVPTIVRPAEVDGTLVVAGTDKVIYFVKPATGDVRREPAGGAVMAEPVANGDYVIVADLDGHVTSYNARTSQRTWRYPQSGDNANTGFQQRPEVIDGEIYVVAVDNRVHVIDAQTGAGKRSFLVREGNVPVRLTSGVVACGPWLLAMDRGEPGIKTTSKPSMLYAFDRQTGDLKWKEPIDGEARFAPVVWQGVAYIVTTQGQITGVRVGDRPERTPSLALSAEVRAEPALHEGVLFVGDRGGTLSALDVRGADISKLWDFKLTGKDGKPVPVTTRPVVSGDLILVSDDWAVFGLRR